MDQTFVVSNNITSFSLLKNNNWPFQIKLLLGLDDDSQYENIIQTLSESNESLTSERSYLLVSQKETEVEIIPKYERKESSYKFRCHYDGCLKKYRSKENLVFHIKNIHLNIKPFQCSFCHLKFSHRNGKIYHERKQHTDDLRYECTVESCKQKFPCKSAMIAHYNSIHLCIKKKTANKGFFSVLKSEVSE